MFTIPVLNVKANPLDALLAVVGYRLSMLAESDNEAFTQLLQDRKVTIQLGSEADDIARYYVFDEGRFEQHAGTAKDPSLSIDFKDALTGVKLLTGGDVSAFMTAIQDKEMSMEGDYSLLMWFNKLAKYIVPTVPEEYQPYVEKAKPYLQKAKPYVYKAQTTAMHLVGMVKHKLNT